jgi:hypothetical protein
MFNGNFNIAVSIVDEHSYPTCAFDIIAALFATFYGPSSDIKYIFTTQVCMQGIVNSKYVYSNLLASAFLVFIP